ncbi:MAG: hypothetical protein WCI57_04770 [Candidatus Berkelbacteria bacterium]
MPKTKLGKWTVWLIVTCVVLLVIGNLVRVAQDRAGIGDWTFFTNLKRTFPMTGGLVAGLAGFFAGLVAVWKEKERSVIVFISLAIGLLLFVMFVAELLSIAGILPPI